MKLGLPVKLGIVVVLIFAVLLLTLIFWTPIKIQYYLSQVRSRDVKKSIKGIEKLLALGEEGREGLIKSFPEGPDAAKLLVDNWNLKKIPDSEKRPPSEFFTSNGMRKTYNRPRVPLGAAVEEGYRKVCEIFIARGADVNAVDASGIPALHRAAKGGSREIAELLLKHGAEVNAPDDERHTPLYYAVGTHKVELVKLLLDKGADPDGKTFQEGATGPTPSNPFGSPPRRWKILDTVDAPLHRAALENYMHIAKVLIDRGADVNAKDRRLQTPLHLAAKVGSDEIVELLVSKKAGVNKKDMYDNTPLHLAAKAGHRDAAEVLLKHAPDLSAVNAKGYTPLELADGYGRKEVADLLREHLKKSPKSPK
ncbi:MAG: ankyrin repeat domain-containing protein [Planctomycetota bacterium]|nr:MAG: ankyrin repeat domain-containing protein [Planctomycetota bacterium]